MNEIPRVVDLELWSSPHSARVPFDGKAVADACRRATGLSPEIVLGLNFVPGPTDVTNTTAMLQSGEASQAEFQEFCVGQNLEPNPSSELSAARFLAFSLGQPIAWLHFPVAPEGRQAAQLVFQWSERERFIVVRGQGEQALSAVELSRFWPHDA